MRHSRPRVLVFSACLCVCGIGLLLSFTDYGVGFIYWPLNSLLIFLSGSLVLLEIWLLIPSIRLKWLRAAAVVAVGALTLPALLFLVIMFSDAVLDTLNLRHRVEEMATLDAVSGSYHLYYLHHGRINYYGNDDAAILRQEWRLARLFDAHKTLKTYKGDGLKVTFFLISPNLGRLVVKQPTYEGGGTEVLDVPL
jgi:hypothetical protein